MRLAPLPVAAFSAALAACSSTPPATSPERLTAGAADKPICTREHVVGSNRAKTICLTAKQRADITDRSRIAGEKIREGGRSEDGTKTGL